jgi:hypothetical protein
MSELFIGYDKKELTMSATRANVLALLFAVPILLFYTLVYVGAWPEQFTVENLKAVSQTYGTLLLYMPVILLLILIPGAALHELIHGITWAFFCKNGLKSIKYGVHWRALTPYCHCKEVLSLWAYMLGGAMPGLIMGVLPALAGILTGYFVVFLFGLFFTLAAAGDMLILWMLRHQKKNDLVQDHPDLIGCFVLRKL